MPSFQIGTVVATLESNDPDSAFGIAGGDINDCFGVNNETGEVFIKRHLDYETTKEMDLWVKVRRQIDVSSKLKYIIFICE